MIIPLRPGIALRGNSFVPRGTLVRAFSFLGKKAIECTTKSNFRHRLLAWCADVERHYDRSLRLTVATTSWKIDLLSRAKLKGRLR